jgi:uncharacterized metal-binding protein YceD (DUF177 family)
MVRSPAPSRTPEFHRPESVAEMRDGEERVVRVEANAAERAALAERFALQAVPRLRAVARLRRVEGGVRAALDIDAEVVQTCVVTLDPLPAAIRQSVELAFAEGAEATAGEVFVDLAGEDPPEPLVGRTIDLGEVVAEHLGLALDPYPRRPGAIFAGLDEGPWAADEGEAGPFAALRLLKR